MQVPVTGRVIASPFAARMPHFDRLLNVFELFEVAQRYFRRTQRFLTVRIPDPPAIMHWTYPLPIQIEGARNIYTLHDLVPLRLPYTTLDNKRAYLRLIRGCLRWGDHICTVSESSLRDIASLFPVDRARVTNTYQTAGLPDHIAPGEQLADWLLRLFNLEHKGYLLFYGALEPKKNVGRMAEAYLASGITTPLVIVGGRAWKSEGELRLVTGKDGKPTEMGRRIRMLDYVPSAWLGALVRGAKAVIFPSLYEGFGLPVLEAMQLGTAGADLHREQPAGGRRRRGDAGRPLRHRRAGRRHAAHRRRHRFAPAARRRRAGAGWQVHGRDLRAPGAGNVRKPSWPPHPGNVLDPQRVTAPLAKPTGPLPPDRAKPQLASSCSGPGVGGWAIIFAFTGSDGSAPGSGRIHHHHRLPCQQAGRRPLRQQGGKPAIVSRRFPLLGVDQPGAGPGSY